MPKCLDGKNGARQQKQLLTSLMKPTTKDLSHLSVQEDFHLRVERAKQNYLTPHRKDDKGELPINEFVACFAGSMDGEK